SYADATRLSQQYIVNMGGQKRPLPTEEFVDQKVGEAIGKIGQTVFKLSTPLAPQQPNHRFTQFIIERSARNYGLNGNTRKTWEANVKRPEQILLPPSEETPNPKDASQVF